MAAPIALTREAEAVADPALTVSALILADKVGSMGAATGGAECGTLRLSGPYGRGTFIELKSGGLLEVGGSYTSALSVTVSSGGTLSYGGLGVFGSAINLLNGGHLLAQESSVSLYVTSNDGAIVDVGDGVKIYYV